MIRKAIHVVCSIIEQDGKFLIAQRPKGKSLEFKWEFPGGKIDENETEKEALRREIKEELGIDIDIGERMTPSLYHYREFTVYLIPYRCRILSYNFIHQEHENIEWVDIDSVWVYDIAAADIPILEEYRSLLGGKI